MTGQTTLFRVGVASAVMSYLTLCVSLAAVSIGYGSPVMAALIGLVSLVSAFVVGETHGRGRVR